MKEIRFSDVSKISPSPLVDIKFLPNGYRTFRGPCFEFKMNENYEKVSSNKWEQFTSNMRELCGDSIIEFYSEEERRFWYVNLKKDTIIK